MCVQSDLEKASYRLRKCRKILIVILTLEFERQSMPLLDAFIRPPIGRVDQHL